MHLRRNHDNDDHCIKLLYKKSISFDLSFVSIVPKIFRYNKKSIKLKNQTIMYVIVMKSWYSDPPAAFAGHQESGRARCRVQLRRAACAVRPIWGTPRARPRPSHPPRGRMSPRTPTCAGCWSAPLPAALCEQAVILYVYNLSTF